MLSERKWSGEAVIRLLLGIFVVVCIGQLVWGALENFNLPISGPNLKLLKLLIMTVSMQGAMLALIAFFVHEQQLSWSQAFGFNSSRNGRAIFIGLTAGVVIVPVAWSLQQLSAYVLDWFNLQPQSQEIVKAFHEAVSTSTGAAQILEQICFGLSVIVIAPSAEEMLFRGILYPTFKQLGRPMLGLWLTSLMFALLHFNQTGFISFAALAFVLVAVYEATDNLLAPIVTHSVFNAANFIYLLYEQPLNRFFHSIT